MKTEDELRRERKRGWIIVAILAPPIVVLTVASLILTQHRVPSGAMIPTVHPGDRVIVNDLAYELGEKPRIGDVASYRADELLLKRIVGGPADTIELRDNVLFLNGKRQHEPFIVLTPGIPSVRNFGPVTIPRGHYFFLGDNRDNSNDSRFHGFIAEDQILGRMIHVLHIGRCE